MILCMSDLLNAYRPSRKGRFLSIVPLELDAVLLVDDRIGRYRRMMAALDQPRASPHQKNANSPNLLRDQLGVANLAGLVLPRAQEQLTQERVQRLLLTSQLLAAGAVLLLQCGQEPLQNQQRTLFGVLFFRWRNKELGVFGPVSRVLGQAGAAEDERLNKLRGKSRSFVLGVGGGGVGEKCTGAVREARSPLNEAIDYGSHCQFS